uniref:DUF674 domain-containing protein n=1 Tax=Nelumbo nucifera TaxID=4432 RepID=A0A822ZMG5_NELNU|nr:TPA_asm: hypothetical protein HUJ06_004193 [Nelumbo nucifera]
MATSKLSLKLMVHWKSNKVVYAEIGKDVVDFLFNLLGLPLATVVRLLKKENMVGCIANLYGSAENLSDDYILPNQSKDSILNPNSTDCIAKVPLLLPKPTVAVNRNALEGRYAAKDGRVGFPKQSFRAIETSCVSYQTREEGYVKGMVSYMLLDDLTVMPMTTVSIISALKKFNIKDVSALVEEDVDLGFNEGVELLGASMQSTTVLSDVFL